MGGKGAGNKKHNSQVQNRQEQVKNSIGNGEGKELICKTHGHEIRGGLLVEGGVKDKGEQRGDKNRTGVIAQSIKLL